MGYIDSKIFELTCYNGKCHAYERVRIYDRGTSDGRSDWEEIPELKKFETVTKGGGTEEPEIISAKCKKCGRVYKAKDIKYSYQA